MSFKALFLNKLASCIYLLTICVVLWPVIAIIFLSSAPNSAAVVAKPDLRLCPPYLLGSNPAYDAYFLIINETLLSDISNISGGSHEISLIYNFHFFGKKLPPKNVRYLECPIPNF